jgi:hypothetical protein
VEKNTLLYRFSTLFERSTKTPLFGGLSTIRAHTLVERFFPINRQMWGVSKQPHLPAGEFPAPGRTYPHIHIPYDYDY